MKNQGNVQSINHGRQTILYFGPQNNDAQGVNLALIEMNIGPQEVGAQGIIWATNYHS